MTKEQEIEEGLIRKLEELKYSHRPDIRDREALEQNFRKQFEALNRVRLTDDEFARLLDDVINPDVFACAEHLRHRNSFEREDGICTINWSSQGLVQEPFRSGQPAAYQYQEQPSPLRSSC